MRMYIYTQAYMCHERTEGHVCVVRVSECVDERENTRVHGRWRFGPEESEMHGAAHSNRKNEHVRLSDWMENVLVVRETNTQDGKFWETTC